MQAVGAKLKEKSARLASRRRAIAEEHASRVGSGDEVYRGDGLLLDNKLDDGADAAAAPHVASAIGALARVCVEESTGEGEESSGDGRYAWGTWVDSEKVNAVVAAVDGARLESSEALWRGPLEGRKAVRLCEGAAWDVTLRCWGGDDDVRDVVQIFPPGSHVLLKPLVGSFEVQKLRRGRDGDYGPLGPRKEHRGASAGVGGSAATGRVARVLGGPPQRLTARPGPCALLEVILRPPTGAADEGRAALEAELVRADLDDDAWSALRDALRSVDDDAPEEEEEEEEEEEDHSMRF